MKVTGLLLVLFVAAVANAQPNVVVLFVDDLGYGDLSCYGHPTIITPNIDKLAASGARFTSWYSASAVCSPSRAALLTARYAVRSGMAGNTWTGGVIGATATGGLPANETVLSSIFQRNNFATKAVGKWHLGHTGPYLPQQRGFDSYYGIPFSNDMAPSAWQPAYTGGCTALPLLANETIIEQPVNLATITTRYTDESIRFINQANSQRRPFFLYLAYNHVHTPNFCSKEICRTSERGAFGDSVLEVDESVRRIVATLTELSLLENTVIFFTSDNGPWLQRRLDGGSAGLLRDGKTTTWEGGFRVPAIISWPGTIAPGQVIPHVATSMDIFPTALTFTRLPLPGDRIIDGKDLSSLLLGKTTRSPWDDDAFFYYKGTPDPVDPVSRPGLWAMRKGSFKLHWVTTETLASPLPTFHDPPLLFNLDTDPSEQFQLNVSQYASVVEDMEATRIKHEAMVEQVRNQAGSDKDLCLCCDPNSQQKYPDLPVCTCNPEYWSLPE